MKKYFKGILALSVLTICGSLVGTVLNSCSEQDSYSAETESCDAKTFLHTFQTNIDSIMLADVVPQKTIPWRKGAKLAGYSTHSDLRPVLLKVPEYRSVDGNGLEQKLSTVHSTLDLVGLVREYHLEYSLLPKKPIVATELSENATTAENTATAGNNTETVGNTVTVATENNTETVENTVTTETADYVIHVSESAARKSLDPLVQESKQYLYSKGFTEKEIQDLLVECGADETDLVRIVLAISSEENSANELAVRQTRSFNTFSLLATPAYAQNWGKITRCTLQTLGVNELAYAFASLKKFTKSAIISAVKATFKTTAKRLLGPIGAIVAITEFGLCMADIW